MFIPILDDGKKTVMLWDMATWLVEVVRKVEEKEDEWDILKDLESARSMDLRVEGRPRL